MVQETVQREARIKHLIQRNDIDLLVIGGGITGAGIFNLAAASGLHVVLLEQKDFAWGTSSRSSKMVHGGLRYLGAGQINLTRDAVFERQKLIEEAPGLVDLMKYWWPHYRGKFPGPFIFRTLLSVYDFFAGKRYWKGVAKDSVSSKIPHLSLDHLKSVTEFADAVTEDARLTYRMISETEHTNHKERNPNTLAMNYIEVAKIFPIDGETGEAGKENEEAPRFKVRVKDSVTGNEFDVFARQIINATGVWASKSLMDVSQSDLNIDSQREVNSGASAAPIIRPLRGSHLVFDARDLPTKVSLTTRHPKDKRPIFIYPWEGRTVVGTTDIDHKQDLELEPAITQEEVDYLLDAANQLFGSQTLNEDKVISSWAGVRPVISEKGSSRKPSQENREHQIWLERGVVYITGGKLTTFRKIAIEALLKLPESFGLTRSELDKQKIFHTPKLLDDQLPFKRLIGHYGHAGWKLLALPGQNLIPGTLISWSMLRWALLNEQVVYLDDLLLRRTRLGLVLPNGGAEYKNEIKTLVSEILHWDNYEWEIQWQRYLDIVHHCYGLPSKNVPSKGLPNNLNNHGSSKQESDKPNDKNNTSTDSSDNVKNASDKSDSHNPNVVKIDFQSRR